MNMNNTIDIKEEDFVRYVVGFFTLGLNVQSMISEGDIVDMEDIKDKLKDKLSVDNVLRNVDIFQMSVLEKVIKENNN